MRAAGFATADLTPAPGGDLCGFIARRQPSLGVAARIRGRVLVLHFGRTRVALVVCDLLGFTLEDSRRIELSVGRAAGVPERFVVLICTHNHSGPMSMPLGTVGRLDSGYARRCERALAKAARRAVADLDDVSDIRLARCRAPDQGRLRIPGAPTGRAWPGELCLLVVGRRSRRPIHVLHYGVHACVLGPANRRVHPDYPGLVCEALERRTGAHAIFLPGAGADVNPRPGLSVSPGVVRRYAEKLAGRALDALAASRPVDGRLCARRIAPRVSFGWLGGAPPAVPEPGREPDDRLARNPGEWARAWREGRYARYVRLPVRLLRLGDLALVAVPAELFWETGRDLGRSLGSVATDVLAISHAGGVIGYLPRSHAYRKRAYEAANAYQWYRTAGSLIPGTEAALRRAIVTELRDMFRPATRKAILRT